MPLLTLENAVKEYRNEEVVTPVLRGLSFSISAGEFVSIMGPSGSGKSTLMHILGFLDTLTGGRYFFKGHDVSDLDDVKLAKMRGESAGFVFQAFNLLPRMSALENVLLPLMYSRVAKEKRAVRAKELLASVGLSHRLNHPPSRLSGGEKQRVAIARALVNEPEVIFADEPTGNLDSQSGLQVMKIFQELNEQGRTIILVTHEKYTAEHAQRVLHIHDGIITKDEPVRDRQLADGADGLTK